MKKYTVFFNPLTARVLLFIFTHLSCQELFSQPEPMSNVGIGTTTPTRAKLEVFGTGGIFSFTSAIFGSDGAGISLQRNRPSIGFNQYNDGNSKFMTTGFAGIQYFDPATGIYALDMLGNGTANANTTVQTRSLTIGNNGNISIKTATGANASLYVVKAGNVDGSAIFAGTQYASFFHYGFNEDTYLRGGKTVSGVIINDVSAGPTVIGGGPTSSTEIRGSLYGYPASSLAPAMNLIPLGLLHYSGTLNNVSSGSFPTNFQNLTGSFVTSSSGFYQNSSTVADYIRITLILDAGIFNQYTQVIGINRQLRNLFLSLCVLPPFYLHFL